MAISENMSPADLAAVMNGDNGFGGNGAWWILLFFFAMGGFGNGWGNQNDVYPYLLNNTTNGLVQGRFDTAALTSQLSGIQSTIANGQLVDLNRSFDSQTAITSGLTNIAAQQAQIAAGTQMAISNLASQLAAEACADRAAVKDAMQTILTQMCDDKIDAKNEQIVSLQNQLNMANLAASQNAQTAQLIADNAAQTLAIKNAFASNSGCGCSCGASF